MGFRSAIKRPRACTGRVTFLLLVGTRVRDFAAGRQVAELSAKSADLANRLDVNGRGISC